MKTTKEMIEVMQAFERGAQIEMKFLDNDDCLWTIIKDPLWDWYGCDYRVKPKKHFVQFDTAEEFLEAQRVHGITLIDNNGIKYSSSINCRNNVTLDCEHSRTYHRGTFVYIFECFHFEDGTPCGKEVEE